jgi:hypothetical protein
MGKKKVNMQRKYIPSPFNSSLESGIRTLVLLETAHPRTLALERLVEFDYLAVHSGDAGGPESLHVTLPYRTGELLVRRELIQAGLALMMSRGLVKRIVGASGINYQASESAGPFLNALTSSYILRLRERATWVTEHFENVTDDQLRGVMRKLFDTWTTQFQPTEQSSGDNV